MSQARLRCKMLGRRTIGALVIAVGFACAAHADETNAPPQEGESDLKELQALIEKVSQLEAAATNDTARLECITDKLVKIKGLLDLTEAAAGRLPALLSEEDDHGIEIARAEISIARARAEKLAAEAETCTSEPPPKPKKHRAPIAAATPAPAQPKSASALVKQPAARSAKDCIAQHELARLLTQAMDLRFDTKKSVDPDTEGLSKLTIEPLGGWHPDQCATLDDLCVVVARALNLKVDSPADPGSYLQALRDDGLPVDTLLPARVEGGDPPVLLEREVREFFAAGYAAPLPSSRPLNPD